jgi:hypothetical protein
LIAPQEHAPPSGSSRTGVATIEAVKAGHRGQFRAVFLYRVRLDDGTRAEITIGEAFAPGARLRLLYSPARAPHLLVHAYELCRRTPG